MASVSRPDSHREIKSVPGTYVIGLRGIVPDYKSQDPLWARLWDFVRSHDISLKADTPCRAVFYDPGYKPSDVDTEVCLVLNDAAALPDNMEEFKAYRTGALPRAAVYTHTGPYDGLKEAYEELMAWIAARNGRISGPVTEIYHVGMAPGQHDEAQFVTEIIVPLA